MRIEAWRATSFNDDLRALVAEACAEGFGWMGDLEPVFTARPFDRTGEGLFLAWAGERLAGVAVISEDHHLQDGETGRLRFIYVSRPFRGRGLAEALTSRCLDQAGRRWKVIRLHTENSSAARLYARHGFVALDQASAQATHAKTLN
jgi:ribosomal protein S18 acetylase RimI-like enzyme